MAKKKPNGHAEGEATETAGTPTGTDEDRTRITARVATDQIADGSDNGKHLRDWLRDTLDIGTVLAHFDDDPDANRRELQNTIAMGLNLDPELVDQLAGRCEGNWPDDPVQHNPAAGQTEAEQAPVVNAAAAEPTAGEAQAEVIRPTMIPRPAALAAHKLKGDITRYILERLKFEQGDRRPWDERPESHQRNTIAQVSDMVEQALREGFALMIGERTRVVTGTLESVTSKIDGIKAVIKLTPNTDNILTLLTGAGERVQIAVADATAFMGFGEDVPIVLDQHVMPLAPEPEQTAEAAPVADQPEEDGGAAEPQTSEETLDKVTEGLAASMTSVMPAEPPPPPVH